MTVAPLPALKWGDSERYASATPVLTIGNPLGLGMSVSAGIVSALEPRHRDTPFDRYIQPTRQSITAIRAARWSIAMARWSVLTPHSTTRPGGGFIGIGFAIPANGARFVVSRLLDPSHPKPGWLGLTLQDVTTELAEALDLRGEKGSIISAVDVGGPASTAGLRPGDILAAINGTKPEDPRAFMRTIVQIPVGQQAHLTVWRDGKEQPVTVTVDQWPNYMPGGGVMSAQMAEAMIQKMPDPGVRLAALTDAARKEFGIDAKVSGVLVASVEADCEARDLGIVTGDVITAAQGAPVATPDDVRHAVQTAHQLRRPFLALLVQGKSGARWVSLSMGGAGS